MDECWMQIEKEDKDEKITENFFTECELKNYL